MKYTWRSSTLAMAHNFITFEATCNEICERFKVSGEPLADDSLSLTLTELFADGQVRSLPVTEKVVETYIEKDFAVSITTIYQ